MAYYFISDLHLDSSRPKDIQQFLEFLKGPAQNAQALYILGDFFEVYLGDDTWDESMQGIVQALADYAKTGIPLYFMQGNRDFLIGEKFIKKSGAVSLTDPFVTEIYGKKVVLCHGDSLCTADKMYQWYRTFVRMPFIKKLFLSFPLTIREKIAYKLRKNSAQKYAQALKKMVKHKNETNYNTDTNTIEGNMREENQHIISDPRFDVTMHAVQKILQDNQADILIHGHTHRAKEETIKLPNRTAKRIVLGEWTSKGAVILQASADGFNLIPLGGRS